MRIINIIQDQILNAFLSSLKSSGLSNNSIKFYKSDLLNFFNWLKLEVRKLGIFAESFKELLPFLNQRLSENYKKHLKSKLIPSSTINRKLSVIRRFSKFLVDEHLISLDFTESTQNISTFSLVGEFQKHLEAKKASKNTVKNYVADVRHFLTWIDKNYAT